MKSSKFFGLCLIALCLVSFSFSTQVSAQVGTIEGEVVILGFDNGGDSGVVILEGSITGSDTLVVYTANQKDMLISLGPKSPQKQAGVHVFCDLKDFSVKIPIAEKYYSCGIAIESVKNGKEGMSIEDLGIWRWEVDGAFEFGINFEEMKALGCWTTGICGNGVKIYGPYCIPCESVLCCYGQVGYINCGKLLCY